MIQILNDNFKRYGYYSNLGNNDDPSSYNDLISTSAGLSNDIAPADDSYGQPLADPFNDEGAAASQNTYSVPVYR